MNSNGKYKSVLSNSKPYIKELKKIQNSYNSNNLDIKLSEIYVLVLLLGSSCYTRWFTLADFNPITHDIECFRKFKEIHKSFKYGYDHFFDCFLLLKQVMLIFQLK